MYKTGVAAAVWVSASTSRTSMASSFSEPSHRHSHQAAAVQQKVYLFGGVTAKEESSSCVHIFDPFTESWTTAESGGDVIPKLCFGACTSSDHFVYVYGGNDQRNRTADAFYKLDTTTLQWTKLDSMVSG